MLEFREVSLSDRDWIRNCLTHTDTVFCDYTFGSLYMWGPLYNTHIAHTDHCFVTMFLDKFYCFPAGCGDLNETVATLRADAKARGIPLTLFGLTAGQVQLLDKQFPGEFSYSTERDSSDYIYATQDLMHLPGKRFHAKRNHIAAFERDNNWRYEPITEKNLAECIALQTAWHTENRDKNPKSIDEEHDAMLRGLNNYETLGFIGGLLRVEDQVVAATFGEPINDLYFCTHMEKANASVRGAYPMINRTFAREALSSYQYINREDDNGDEGLRRAKLSYHPAMLLEKYLAVDNTCP